MKKTILSIAAASAICTSAGHSSLIISQYVETNGGSTPKGIELLNTGATLIDFSITNLAVQTGVNGGAPATNFSLSIGTLAPGEVLIIGTSDIQTYLNATFGNGAVQFHTFAWAFNGDDSMVIQLGGITEDVLGIPGSDPGAAWEGNGVSTANQNISLLPSITSGDINGWTDPSERFVTTSIDPRGTGGLSGFGTAPIPEPSSVLITTLGLGLVFRRRR